MLRGTRSNYSLLGHRYYDPATGRFLNRDPIGTDGGENLYNAFGGNPVNEIDPEGTDAVVFWGADGKSHDSYFRDAAYAYAAMYEKQNAGKKAYVTTLIGILHPVSVIGAELMIHKNIDTIIYTGHAGIAREDTHDKVGKSPYVSKLYCGVDDINASQIVELPTKNVVPNATIKLLGCNTATSTDPLAPQLTLAPGQITIGQAFANHFHTTVEGFNNHPTFGISAWSNFWRGTDYTRFHKGSQPLNLVNVFPDRH